MKNQNKTINVNHLTTVLNCIDEGVFTVDADKKITFFNRAAERITGFAADEAIGKRCSDVFRANVCGRNCILDEAARTENGITQRKVCIIDRNGQSISVCVNAAMLANANGKFAGGIETFRDMSTEEELRRRVEGSYSFQDIVSRHPKMHEIFAILPDVADSEVPVLIEGDSGTGKELLARAIHNLSKRKDGPFIAINCGALPDSLLESELFGYKKGAFTDAKTDKPGRFGLAKGGTLFLDEIGNVSQAMQVRLLRVLQEKTFEPVGATESVKTNVRIVAATNIPLKKLINDGVFRQDLYYRLNVMRLELPPLKERRCDIPLLAEDFRRRLKAETGKNIEKIEPTVFDVLMNYDFPGNVRELENAMQHAFVLCRSNALQRHHLPPELVAAVTDEAQATPRITAGATLEELEKQAIRQTLAKNNGHRRATAEELGVDTSTLYRKMQRYGIKDS